MQESVSADKTKDFIVQALFALMETMPFEKISVTDITKKAGIGRATYYRHFETKEDIIRYFFTREMHGFNADIHPTTVNKDDCYEMIFRVFSGMKEKKDALSVIIKAHLESIYLEFLNKSMLENHQERWQQFSVYEAYYAAGCLFNVSLAWVRNDCAESVKTMADMYFAQVFPDEKKIF
ncbi:MAG: TetR/AcrR family transcriptional regulator [Treponema sp.]|nr:TetR/AcrR family transcriptional regulator [Treponema sp.]